MKALVVYNPVSGKENFITKIEYITNELSKRYEIVDIFPSNAPKSIITRISNTGSYYDMIIVAGGDGTLNEAINGLMKIPKNNRPTIAYIPAGTCNDVGKMLKIKGSYKKMTNIILNGEEVEMDICRVNDHHFLYACGMGNISDISYKASSKMKKRFGRMAYFFEGIKHLADDQTMNLKIKCNDITYEGKYYLFLALNSKRIGGFSIYRTKRPKLDDGLIDVSIFKKRRVFLNLFSLFGFFLFGDLWNWTKIVETIQCNEIKITSLENISTNVDGEFFDYNNEKTIKVLTKEVKIMVNKKTNHKYFTKK